MIQKDILKRLLGSFWLSIFKDTWFISNIIKLYLNFLSKRLKSAVYNISNKADIGREYDRSIFEFPKRILINALSIAAAPYTIALKKGCIFGTTHLALKNLENLCALLISGDTSGNYIRNFVFPKLHDLNKSIHKSVLYHISNNKIYLKGIKFSTLNLKQSLLNLNNLPVRCYLAWCVTQPSVDILDTCCSLLNLPLLWLCKYPKVVKQAFKTHFTDLSLYDIKLMLGYILDYRICLLSGLVAELQNIYSPYYVIINDIKYFSKHKPTVLLGAYVSKGLSLFESDTGVKYPKILTYKDNITKLQLPYLNIPTIIGLCSVLNLPKLIKKNNVLPILVPLQLLSKYNLQLTKMDKAPLVYGLIAGQSINPVLFLIRRLWRKRFCFILLPGDSDNILDIQILIKFIKRNIDKSSMLFVQHSNNIEAQLLLDFTLNLTIIDYYNNNLRQTEVLFDITQLML